MSLPIRFWVGNDWIKTPPTVILAEMPSWLKVGDEWHINERLDVCYEFPGKWTSHFETLKEARVNEDLSDLAAQWILNGTTHVLSVNYKCHLMGRTSWPDFIPFWPHSGVESAKLLKKEA
jgi:hypothetical protein